MNYLKGLFVSLLVLLAAELASDSARAQGTGRYETLNEDQIVERLMPSPQPAPRQIIVKTYTPDELYVRYDLIIQIPSITLGQLSFETNSSQLTVESAVSLTKLANALNRIISSNPKEVILIEGHTDFPGSSSHNLALSYERAKAVSDYLVSVGGVPARNFLVKGFGREQLLIKTDKSEARNRRVEVRLITRLVVSE
jgi:outer membrane protein OmpA-like peptidoglycan-associated protein